MPLLGTGWLSGYAVTTLIGLSRKLKLTSTRASPLAAKKLLSSSTCSHSFGDVKKVMTDVSSKPPNVLIYCGSNDTDNRIFNNVKHTLLRVLNVHSYAIYGLQEQHVSTQPWMDNTALLVIRNHDSVSTSVQKKFIKYLKAGGKILGLCSSFTPKVVKRPLKDRSELFIGTVEVCHPGLNQQGLQNVLALVEPFYFEGGQTVVAQDVKTKKPVIIQVTEGHGTAVYTLVHLELVTDGEIAENQELDAPSLNHWTQSEDARMSILSQILQLLGLNCQRLNAPILTPVYLLAKKEDEQKLLQSLRSRLKGDLCKGKDLSLHFVTSGKPIPKTTETILPVITEVKNYQPLSFDWKKYQACLQTKLLGQMVFYADVITSTQAVFDGNYTFVQSIPDDVGVIVVTGQQMKGQGRGGNMWLSPVGCMMFSLHVKIPFSSSLGQRPPFLQHIASLAAVEAVRSQPGYEDINVCLKWPNDIYFGHKVKIGGVIVTSSATNGTLSAVIGMGVNVANSKPTISINEIISQYNKDHKTNLQSLPIEETLARTVNSIEKFIDDFQNNGKKSFLKKYYDYWLHSDARIKLLMNDTEEEVTITGLDDYGFLQVQAKSGKTLSVQPDGNTFDMLKNLIAAKSS